MDFSQWWNKHVEDILLIAHIFLANAQKQALYPFCVTGFNRKQRNYGNPCFKIKYRKNNNKFCLVVNFRYCMKVLTFQSLLKLQKKCYSQIHFSVLQHYVIETLRVAHHGCAYPKLMDKKLSDNNTDPRSEKLVFNSVLNVRRVTHIWLCLLETQVTWLSLQVCVF